MKGRWTKGSSIHIEIIVSDVWTVCGRDSKGEQRRRGRADCFRSTICACVGAGREGGKEEAAGGIRYGPKSRGKFYRIFKTCFDLEMRGRPWATGIRTERWM